MLLLLIYLFIFLRFQSKTSKSKYGDLNTDEKQIGGCLSKPQRPQNKRQDNHSRVH